MFSLPSSLQASEMTLEYPGWALAMIIMLIILASSPVPIGYLHAKLKQRGSLDSHGEQGGGQEMHRELYTKCNSTELLDSRQQTPGEEEAAFPRTAFLPIGSEQYRLLPQQEEEEEEEDTGVWAQRGCYLKKVRVVSHSSLEKIFGTLSLTWFYSYFNYLYHWMVIINQINSFFFVFFFNSLNVSF